MNNAWQPIETAPRDGTIIDIWANGERITDCKWISDDFYCFEDHGDYESYWDWFKVSEWHGNPTHWMPVPAPPLIKL